MEKKLFLDAGVCVGADLYFTATNSHCLYRRSTETGTVSAVSAMATGSARTKKFAGMFLHQNRIWMIPWNEDYFWIYDIGTDEMKHLEVPGIVRKSDKGAVFRRAVAVGKYIWAMPNWAECIMRIDMEQESFDLYADWPEGVIVRSDEPNFKSISYDEEKARLYLFREGCNENIVLDTNDGSMKIFKLSACGEFCSIKNNRIVVSPVKTGKTVRIFQRDGEKAVLEREVELPDDVWAGEELYAYWYVDYVEGKWFLLPNEANALLVINENLDLDIVKIPADSYREGGNKKVFAGYETIKMGDEIWILPYEGSQILVLDGQNRIVNWIKLTVSSADEKDEMEGLFAEVLGTVRGKWKNADYESGTTGGSRSVIGTEIYEALKC